MIASALTTGTSYLRQRMLGSEAVYRVIEHDGETVTAEVVYAPGLQHGTRVRLLARAAASMERIEGPEPTITARRGAVVAA